MSYRDDREALRQKVETLESELTRRESELVDTSRKLAQHEEKDVEDEAQLESLRSEVGRLRARLGLEPRDEERAKKKASQLIFATAAVALAIAAAVTVLLVEDDHERAQVAESTTKPPEPAVSGPLGALPAPPTPSPAPLPITEGRVVFGAVVLEAEGVNLSAGDGCLLDLDLAHGPEVMGVRLRCGERTLYDSRDALGAGMEMRSELAGESPALSGGLVYALTFQDHGRRSGPRAQLLVDSLQHTMRVWSETGESFAVSLHVNERSFERRGEPLDPRIGQLPVEQGRSVRARAEVSRRRGPVPSFVDGDCELHASPYSRVGEFNCRVMLRCGTELVYGKGTAGFNECTFVGGVPGTANDVGATVEDGDPRMSLDWARRRMTVSDIRGAEEWTIDLRLEPPSLPALRGTWDGTLRVEGEEPVALTLEVDRRGRASWQVAEGAPPTGEAWLAGSEGERPEGATEFHFGPGFATLFGRTANGDALELMRRR